MVDVFSAGDRRAEPHLFFCYVVNTCPTQLQMS